MVLIRSGWTGGAPLEHIQDLAIKQILNADLRANGQNQNFAKLMKEKECLQAAGQLTIVRLDLVNFSIYPGGPRAPADAPTRFFQSQLLLQGFYEHSHDLKEYTQLLNFLQSLTQPSKGGSNAWLWPSIFMWTTGLPKKEYFIFAMASPNIGWVARCYSVEELLHMRLHLPVVNFALSRLNKQADIGTRQLLQQNLDDH